MSGFDMWGQGTKRFDFVRQAVSLVGNNTFQHGDALFKPAFISRILGGLFGYILRIKLHLPGFHIQPGAENGTCKDS
jgi:hypothetical protein